MEIKRGTVWWWRCPQHNRTHIQQGIRPVVIVSNDSCNHFSDVVTVVPFTTRARLPYPQQVPVVFEGNISIALADQLTSVPVDELGDYICELTPYQMDMIDTAISIQLGFSSVSNRPYSPFLNKENESVSYFE